MKKIKKELRRMKDDINREKSIEEMTNKAQDVKEELIQKIRDFLNNGIEIIFVGNSMSSTYIQDLIDYLENKDFSINIISKSGTTTEPAIAFRIFRDLLKKK